jgi:UDP-N-acetylglucosamine acyltransferase
VRVGSLALIGGCSKVTQDVPPFMIADGHPARVYAINTVGLDRAGYSKEEKLFIRKSLKIIFRSGLTLKNAMARLEEECQGRPFPSLKTLTDFLNSSERGICR